jgi:UDP-N-acetyl-D-mannosaminuronate dehydrogenase
VTVGTPLGPDFEPIVDEIKAAARAVGEHLHKGHLVILKSTCVGWLCCAGQPTDGDVAGLLDALRCAADSRLASSYPQAQVPQHVSVWILTTSLVSGSHDLVWPIPQRVSLIGAC